MGIRRFRPVLLVLSVLFGLIVWACDSDDIPQHPEVRSASGIESSGIETAATDVDWAVSGSYIDMVSGGRIPIGVLVEARGRDEPYLCQVETRVFVNGLDSERLLIYKPGLLQRDQVLPRDILNEFPYANRHDQRAVWFDIVETGQEWSSEDCEDFTVVHGNKAVLFISMWAAVQRHDSGGRVIVPDIIIPSNAGIQWDIKPSNPDEWSVRWLLIPEG